jgi:hypothetical protein
MISLPRDPEEAKAYIAGMVDGDGHIGQRFNRKGQGRVTLNISNTYYPLMEWLVEQGGGNLVKRGKVCLTHCIQSHVHRRKIAWRWVVQGERAIIILENISPYLMEKKELAQQVASEGRARLSPNGGHNVRYDMLLRGWQV